MLWTSSGAKAYRMSPPYDQNRLLFRGQCNSSQHTEYVSEDCAPRKNTNETTAGLVTSNNPDTDTQPLTSLPVVRMWIKSLLVSPLRPACRNRYSVNTATNKGETLKKCIAMSCHKSNQRVKHLLSDFIFSFRIYYLSSKLTKFTAWFIIDIRGTNPTSSKYLKAARTIVSCSVCCSRNLHCYSRVLGSNRTTVNLGTMPNLYIIRKRNRFYTQLVYHKEAK